MCNDSCLSKVRVDQGPIETSDTTNSASMYSLQNCKYTYSYLMYWSKSIKRMETISENGHGIVDIFIKKTK